MLTITLIAIIKHLEKLFTELPLNPKVNLHLGLNKTEFTYSLWKTVFRKCQTFSYTSYDPKDEKI